MKLEMTCRNDHCKFEFWELEFDDEIPSGHIATERCPHCDMLHAVTINIKLLGEYNEDKEDR